MKRNRFLLSRLSISVAVLVAIGLLPVGGSAQTSSQTPPSTVRVPQTTQPRPRTPVQTPVQQLPDWKTPHRIPVFTDVAIEVTSSGRTELGSRIVFTLNPYNAGLTSIDAGNGVTVIDTVPSNFSNMSVSPSQSEAWRCTPVAARNTISCRYIGGAIGPHARLPSIAIEAVGVSAGDFRNCATIALAAGRELNLLNNRSCANGRVQKSGKTVDVTGAAPPVAADVSIANVGIEGAGKLMYVGNITEFQLGPFNNGPATIDAGNGLTIIYTFAPNFSDIDFASSGWNCSLAGQTLTCDYTGGQVAPQNPMPQIMVGAVANGPGDFNNCATISMLTPEDANPADNQSCFDGEVIAEPIKTADLSLVISVVGNLNVGSTAEFELKPFNKGPATADASSSITVTDTFPSNFSDISVSQSPGWNCSVAGQTVTCDYIGGQIAPLNDMPKIIVQATPTKADDYNNCAEIKFKIGDGSFSLKQSCVSVIVATSRAADVGIVTSGGGNLIVGETARFELAPFNKGPLTIDARSGLTVTDENIEGLSNISVSQSPGWNCSVDGETVTCNYTGAQIAPLNDMPKIAIQAVANTQGTVYGGGYSNCATVAFKYLRDTDTSNNQSCVHGGVAYATDVGIRVWGGGDVNVGATITFQLDPFRLGALPIDADSGLTVTDTIPDGFTNISVTESAGWNCSVAGQTVTCNYTGGQWSPIILQAVAEKAGTYENNASISVKNAHDSNPSNDYSSAKVTVTAPPS